MRSARAPAGLACLALAGAALLGATRSLEDAGARRPARLERIGAMGASITDGFSLAMETDAMITLADVIDACCVAPGTPAYRRSSSAFFLDARRWGEVEAASVAARDPTLVVAIDYLFWFAYGPILPESRRLDLLEKGLQKLERFSCTVVVGDIPDMTPALKGVGIHGRPMIQPSYVPDPETLRALNRRIREFAAAHPNVVVAPLAGFVSKLRSGETIEIRDNTWTVKDLKTFQDPDLLHTTLDGTIALTLFVFDHLVKEGLLPADALRWDMRAIRARILEAHAEEIAQRRATARRRASAA